MSVIKLNTGFNIEVEFAIAPFHKRFFAWVLDLVVQFAYLYLGGKFISIFASSDWDDSFGWALVLFYIPILLYHLLFEIMWNGQSPGKRALNIRVITTEGGQPSVSQYLIRWMFKTIDIPIWIIGLVGSGIWPPVMILLIFTGLACMIFTPKTQRVGDLIAGTIIINTRNKASWQDTVFMEVDDNYQPSFPEVMRLSDRDINTIKQIINTSARSNDYSYAWRIAEKIKTILQVKSDLPPIEFMQLLLKDYNHLSTK